MVWVEMSFRKEREREIELHWKKKQMIHLLLYLKIENEKLE